MKKAMFYLLVLGFLFLVPLAVYAATLTPSIPNNVVNEVKNSDGTISKTYNIYVAISNNTDNTTIKDAEFEFTTGTAVESFQCGDANTFVATTTSTGANSGKCTFAIPNDGSVGAANNLVGTITVKVKANAKDEDCVINYSYNGSSGSVNPQTGVSLPYAVIAGGLLIATGVYFVTKKRTKLFRI